jgi:hypothetical protein
MDRIRNKTPEFLRKNEIISQKNEEKFLDFSSQIEIDLSANEEITKSSFINNSDANVNKKVIFKKKTKKIDTIEKEKEKEKNKAPDIIFKRITEKCCSDDIKENCLIF